MTLEQKIKGIESYLNTVNQRGVDCPAFMVAETLEEALRVIREQQKQLDRVRDTEKLKDIIDGVKSLCDYEHVLDYPEITKQLQNYILGGEGV